MSIQAQLTVRPTRRPLALSDRRDQEPLLRPGPRQSRRRPYSRIYIIYIKKINCEQYIADSWSVLILLCIWDVIFLPAYSHIHRDSLLINYLLELHPERSSQHWPL